MLYSVKASHRSFVECESQDRRVDCGKIIMNRLGPPALRSRAKKIEMGKGVDFMEGTHKWHGIAPNDQQLEDALNQLDETLGDY